MKRIALMVAVALALAALALSGSATAQESNTSASQEQTLGSTRGGADALQTTEETHFLVFEGPSQVYAFSVEMSDKHATLVVDTRDCCLEGDKWGVRIFSAKEKKDGEVKKLKQVAETCGTGSVYDFSGEATATKSETYIVEVFYCEGVDIFPAGMDVRFQYEGGTGAATLTEVCQNPDKTCQSGKKIR
jgi:hypothetical protein